jgi:4-carboxymuconolactone decarboxylase
MRLPLIPPEQLTPEQQTLYEDMRKGIDAIFKGFATIREDGALMGPWNPWLHEPQFGKPVWVRLVQGMTATAEVHRPDEPAQPRANHLRPVP